MTLTLKQKYYIIFNHEKGYTSTYIAKEMKINRKTVDKWIKQYKLDENLERKKRSGNLRKTNDMEDTKIIDYVKKYKYITSRKIKDLLEADNINISVSTITNRLNESNFKYKKPIEVPTLTIYQKNIRMEWALNNQNTDWDKVLFSDETSIWKGPNGHKRWIDINNKEDTDLVFKYPLKKHIWGCIKKNGPNRIHIFDGIMNANMYMNILHVNILDLFFEDNELIFQDDNDPKHRARLLCQWKFDFSINSLNWPPNSPDLNPIENIWHLLKNKLECIENQTSEEFIKSIEIIWKNISIETINNIIDSMPRRIEKVILNSGNYIDY